MRIAHTIDLVLHGLKWPVACLTLLLLPGTVFAIFDMIRRMVGQSGLIWPFLGGCALYALLWQLLFRHRVFGTLLSTFEHELTHALFALATLHPVTGLRATAYRGGHVTIRGQGNWLITIAPYFFPTVCVLVGLLALLMSSERSAWISGLMGFAFAYHIVSTNEETHPGQSDLHRVGFLFAGMFLPTAVLISMGSVVAFTCGGWATLLAFLGDVIWQTRDLMLAMIRQVAKG
jgi:hypothetical protein